MVTTNKERDSDKKTMVLAIAGPLIQQVDQSNRHHIAKLPVAFGYFLPSTDNSATTTATATATEKTSKEQALVAIKNWYDRGTSSIDVAAMTDRTTTWDDDAHFHYSSLVNPSNEEEEKDDNKEEALFGISKQSTQQQQQLPKITHTIAVAGPRMELTSFNREHIAKLPLAFTFILPTNGDGSTEDESLSSKQLAMRASENWYEQGKEATLAARDGRDEVVGEVRMDGSRCDGDSTNCYTQRHVDDISYNKRHVDEISKSKNVGDRKRKKRTNKTFRKHSSRTRKQSKKNTMIRFRRSAILVLKRYFENHLIHHLINDTIIGMNNNENNNNTNCIVRCHKSAIPFLQKYFETFLVEKFFSQEERQRLYSFPASSTTTSTTTQSLINHHHQQQQQQQQQQRRRRPMVILVEVSDCPSGLPAGWTSETYQRASGKSAGRADTYWFTPQKKYKFRSRANIERFLKILNAPTMDGDETAAWEMFKRRYGH